jgi:hypothetical protein
LIVSVILEGFFVSENSTPVRSSDLSEPPLTDTKRKSEPSNITRTESVGASEAKDALEVTDSIDRWVSHFFKISNPSEDDMIFLALMRNAGLEHAEAVAVSAGWDCEQARKSLYAMIGKPHNPIIGSLSGVVK